MENKEYIIKLIPLQHKFHCPVCQANGDGEYTARALRVADYQDNRTYHTCLGCGTEYVMHNPNDDEIRTHIAGYPLIRFMLTGGQLPVCHLEERP